MSQRPLPVNVQHSQQTDIHSPRGIRIHNLSRRAAVDLRLRPRGQWDRPHPLYGTYISFKWVLLLTGSQCKTLSKDCAFLTCITMLPLIRGQCCTASNMTHMLPSKDVTSYRRPILYRIRRASVVRNALHTS